MEKMNKEEIKIKSLYKWWRNPIKWFKQRKAIKFMNIMVNHEYKNGMKEELERMQKEVLLYGFTRLYKK